MSRPFPEPNQAFPSEPEAKRRGCLFYGCIVAAVLVVLFGLLVGLGTWMTYKATSQLVQQYAEDAPAPIPVVERPAPEVKAIGDRIDRFADDLAAGKETGPLELSADEVNAIIASVDQLRGVVAVDFSDDTMRGKVSLPLSRLGFPIGTLFGGKYLNGVATLDAKIVDGRPVVKLVGLDARGKPIPEAFLDALREQNLLEDMGHNAGFSRAAGRLQSIDVKGGKLVLTPKPPTKGGQPAEPEGKPTEPKVKSDPAEKPSPKP